MKKNLLAIMMMALSMVIAVPTAAYAEEGTDNTAPVVNSVYMDASSYYAGNTATLYVDITEEGTEGVVLQFAANGMLPGQVTVRIKSDYITNKFGLNSNLYLACIMGTIEEEAEYSYTRYEWPLDEDGNPIFYNVIYNYDEEGNMMYATTYIYDENGNVILDENNNPIEYTYPIVTYEYIEPTEVEEIIRYTYLRDALVQIENANVTLGADGYITINLDHNSSYVLTNKMPESRSNASNSQPENNSSSSGSASGSSAGGSGSSGGASGGSSAGGSSSGSAVSSSVSNTTKKTTTTTTTTNKNSVTNKNTTSNAAVIRRILSYFKSTTVKAASKTSVFADIDTLYERKIISKTQRKTLRQMATKYYKASRIKASAK